MAAKWRFCQMFVFHSDFPSLIMLPLIPVWCSAKLQWFQQQGRSGISSGLVETTVWPAAVGAPDPA